MIGRDGRFLSEGRGGEREEQSSGKAHENSFVRKMAAGRSADAKTVETEEPFAGLDTAS